MSGLSTTASKTARTLLGQTSNGAGAETVGSAVDLSTALGMVVVGRVSNGSSPPGAGCAFVVEISGDGQSWRTWSRQVAGTAADESYTFVVDLPAAVMQARVRFAGNTGEAVTVEASGQELSGLSHS